MLCLNCKDTKKYMGLGFIEVECNKCTDYTSIRDKLETVQLPKENVQVLSKRDQYKYRSK